MTRETHRGLAFECAADGCHDVPVIGSPYCIRHAPPTPAPGRSARTTWIWIAVLVAGILAAWLLFNSRFLLGAA